MSDPFNEIAIRALEFVTGLRVIPFAAIPADVEAALDRMVEPGHINGQQIDVETDEIGETDLDRLKDLASEAPVIRLVNQLITKAVEAKASDIHIEATDGGLRVRYRIDGVLREVSSPQANLRSAIVSRVKIMAKLDIAERRLAQDGRIRLPVRGRDIDFRVSTTPSVHGESTAIVRRSSVLQRLGRQRGHNPCQWPKSFAGMAQRPAPEALRQCDHIARASSPNGSNQPLPSWVMMTISPAPRRYFVVRRVLSRPSICHPARSSTTRQSTRARNSASSASYTIALSPLIISAAAGTCVFRARSRLRSCRPGR